MSTYQFTRLFARVEEIERVSQQLENSATIREDAQDLVEELLVYSKNIVNFPHLETRLKARRALDLQGLRQASRYLRTLRWPTNITLTPALTIQPAEKLDSLDADINAIETLLANDPAASLNLALDLRVGGTLLHLVMGAITCGFSLTNLVELAKEKVDLLDKQQVVQLWSYVQEEFDPQRDTRMELIPGILPADFLTFGNDAEARDKLTRYIVEWKPKLMLASHQRKGPGYPMEVPSLPSVLSWKASNTIDAPSLAEIRLGKSMGRIIRIASLIFHVSLGELAAVLQLDSTSHIVRAGHVISVQQPTLPVLFYELRKAIRLLSDLALPDADFPVSIQRYRWGLEVMAPHLIKAFSKKDELLLQRELARFTLERGFFVVGTKFGRAETDLVTWQKEALYIVETKLFRGNGNVSPKAIKSALAQLRNYMDQHPSTPRGLLVLYNLTPCHISAPERWLAERFLIVPINMQPKPPSHRKHSLEILEGDDQEIIKVLPLSSSTTKPRKTKPRKTKITRSRARKGQ